MHSLVPFLTTMRRSRPRLSVKSVEVSPGCVCKGGSDLIVISFPGSELDSWTCFCSGMAFSLEFQGVLGEKKFIFCEGDICRDINFMAKGL